MNNIQEYMIGIYSVQKKFQVTFVILVVSSTVIANTKKKHVGVMLVYAS